jgi:DNA-binding GntR family transcriptional regulator
MSMRRDLGAEDTATRSSRADIAYRRLKAAIEGGTLAPGRRMREAELAEWLGISRTPVRDALKQLESDGLLVAAPRRGLVVAALDQQQVSEIYALRDVLEGLAAHLAAQQASAAEIAALEIVLDRQAETLESDGATLAQLNHVFHDRIYRTARNRYLLQVLGALESSLALLPGTTYDHPGRAAGALTEHQAIVKAIAAHDPEAAECAARAHIRAAERIRLLMLLTASEGRPDGIEAAAEPLLAGAVLPS